MTHTSNPKYIFQHTSFGNILAGVFMVSLSLLTLWLIYVDKAEPRKAVGFTIVAIIFLAIGLMGAWDAAQTRAVMESEGRITISRIRLLTNQTLFRREVRPAEIGYIQYAHTAARGGGLWLVLKDGTRLALATLDRVPFPLAVWPSGYIRRKGEGLSRSLSVPIV